MNPQENKDNADKNTKRPFATIAYLKRPTSS